MILIILLIMGSVSYSDPIDSDRLLWTDIQLNYKLSKNYETSYGQQLRYDLNDEALGWQVHNLEISRKINKIIRLSSLYRFKNRLDAKQHSFYLNFYYRNKKKPISLYYRLRYNKKLRFGKSDDTIYKKRDEDHIRGRLLAKYSLAKNIMLATGTEIFYLVNNKKYANGFDIFRYYVGFEFDINKKNTFEIQWVYEEVFNLGKRNKENIIKLQYSVDIN